MSIMSVTGKNQELRRGGSTAVRVLVLAVTIFILAGCQKSGDDLVDRSVTILSDAIGVLEQHSEEPQNAIPAFRRFLEENEARIRTLERDSEKIAKHLSAEDRTRLKRRFLDAIEPLDARMRALSKAYSAHPEVLSELERVAQNLGAKP